MTTILAVDDSVTIRKCLEIAFSGTGIDLVAVDSADAALEKVKTISPDLVIADASLPPNDGYELVDTIKLASPQLPVLMLSSKQNPFDPAKGAQADAHLDKPFDTQVIHDRARELIDAEPSLAADVPAAQPRAATPSSKPVAMPERAPSSKIPAPRRKRPTPAMVAAVAGDKTPKPAPAVGRRTVPFAMPGSAKKPDGAPSADEVRKATDAARTATAAKAPEPTPPPIGRAARRTPTQPQYEEPLGGPRRPPSDTLPGTRKPREMTEVSPGSQAAAQPAASTEIGGGVGAVAAPGAAVVPVEAAADLQTQLSALGLTKEQMEGVLALSRELVEQVVWEVVPTLAETLIQEEIKRLTQD